MFDVTLLGFDITVYEINLNFHKFVKLILMNLINLRNESIRRIFVSGRNNNVLEVIVFNVPNMIFCSIIRRCEPFYVGEFIRTSLILESG